MWRVQIIYLRGLYILQDACLCLDKVYLTLPYFNLPCSILPYLILSCLLLCCLNSLRFADDVLLMAGSRAHIADMLADLQSEASKYGLRVHAGKTKVLTNERREATGTILLQEGSVKVLAADEHVKYLGRKLTIKGSSGTEFVNRIAAAWASFSMRKNELTNKRYSLKARVRLLDATVGATLLYGSETPTLKVEQRRRIPTTQRKMMRMIFGAKRRKLEASSSDDSSISIEEEGQEAQLEPWSRFLKRTA